MPFVVTLSSRWWRSTPTSASLTWLDDVKTPVWTRKKETCRINPRRDKRATLAPKEREGCSSKRGDRGGMGDWVEVGAKAGTSQLQPQSGRGWRGSKPPEQAPSHCSQGPPSAAGGGCSCRRWGPGPHEERLPRRFRVRFGQNTHCHNRNPLYLKTLHFSV